VAIKADKSIHHYWSTITRYFGLEESLGKTFVSRRFVNINSTNYIYNNEEPALIQVARSQESGDISLKTRVQPYQLVKYVNMGLMSGLKRSQGVIGLGDQGDPRTNLAARAKALLHFTPERLKEAVYQRFINKHRSILDKLRIPWFIPEWLGGVGLPIEGGHEPSQLDLRLARKVLLGINIQPPERLSRSQGTWKVRKMAQRYLPDAYTHRASPQDPTVELYERAIGLFGINLLFDQQVLLSDLREATQLKGSVAQALRKNAGLYRLPRGPLPEPLPMDALEYKPLQTGLNIESVAQSISSTEHYVAATKYIAREHLPNGEHAVRNTFASLD